MKRSRLLILAMLLMVIGAQAQSVRPSAINATGGAKIIGSNDFEWSVGEMTLVSTFTTPSVIVTQGVLQPGDVTLGVPATGDLSKALRVFPNPATDYVNVQYTSPANGTLSCRLFDVAGKDISSQNITVAGGHAAGQIDIRSLAAATYMLEVTFLPDSGSPEISAYKIQKYK